MSNDPFALTHEELSSNVGDIFRPNTPSLYEELFDGKSFNELIAEDPLLSETQTTTNGNGNGHHSDLIVTTSAGNTGMTNLLTQNQKNELGMWNNTNSDQGTSSMVSSGGNADQNVFNGFQNGYHGVTSSQQPISVQNTMPIQQRQTAQVQPIFTQQHQPIQQQQMMMQPQIPKPYQVSSVGAWQQQQPTSTHPQFIMARIPSNPMPIKVKTEPYDPFSVQAQSIRSRNHSSASSINEHSNLTRGAAYAREYRLKNKKRVNQLESDNERLWRENQELKEAYEDGQRKIQALTREIAYLRQVLANDSALSTLMNTVVTNAAGLKFQAPIFDQNSQGETSGGIGMKRKATGDPNSKERKFGDGNVPSRESPGVCFHVNGDLVSVEFCPRCNRDAKRGRGDQQ